MLSDFVMDMEHPVPPNFPIHIGRDEIPAHVRPESVFDSGVMFSDDYLAAPHEFMAAMHEKYPPVFYDINHKANYWMFTKHADCLQVLRQTDAFRTLDSLTFPRDPDDWFYFIPEEVDPPHHRKYRNIVDKIFCPAGVLALADTIRQRANLLIDAFVEKGECEFAHQFARPLPVTMFSDIVGLPHDMLDTFVIWADKMVHSPDNNVRGEALAEAMDYLKRTIDEKKAKPDGKVIDLIINAEIDGRPISEKEIFGFVQFLFLGGLDTVYATMNHIWYWLAQNPDRVQEIIARPDDIDRIVEELLRRFGVAFATRVVMKDVEMRGITMREGDRVWLILPAANFDAEVFPDPLAVDFDRPRRTIQSFGLGVHSCMGAHLARLEVKIALQEWLKRIPEFSVSPDANIRYYPGSVVTPSSLPLIWSPIEQK